MEKFQVYPVSLARGALAISPMPGRGGDYAGDLETLLQWHPGLVLSMVETEELDAAKAAGLPDDLRAAGVEWCHLPVKDFGIPSQQTQAAWPAASHKARAILSRGGRVLAHCKGGKGRSGMAVLRLMVEIGEEPETALATLRGVQQGAVETAAQLAWAFGGR